MLTLTRNTSFPVENEANYVQYINYFALTENKKLGTRKFLVSDEKIYIHILQNIFNNVQWQQPTWISNPQKILKLCKELPNDYSCTVQSKFLLLKKICILFPILKFCPASGYHLGYPIHKKTLKGFNHFPIESYIKNEVLQWRPHS